MMSIVAKLARSSKLARSTAMFFFVSKVARYCDELSKFLQILLIFFIEAFELRTIDIDDGDRLSKQVSISRELEAY
jgi:hypothetical protein